MAIEKPNLNSDQVLHAALLIRRQDFGPATIDLIRNIVDDGYWISSLVRNLVHVGGMDGLNYDDSAAQAEHDLESLANVNMPLACVLMAGLWPIVAAIHGMHTESDSINICLYECKDPDLLKYLIAMVLDEDDTWARARYEECIQFKKEEVLKSKATGA